MHFYIICLLQCYRITQTCLCLHMGMQPVPCTQDPMVNVIVQWLTHYIYTIIQCAKNAYWTRVTILFATSSFLQTNIWFVCYTTYMSQVSVMNVCGLFWCLLLFYQLNPQIVLCFMGVILLCIALLIMIFLVIVTDILYSWSCGLHDHAEEWYHGSMVHHLPIVW